MNKGKIILSSIALVMCLVIIIGATITFLEFAVRNNSAETDILSQYAHISSSSDNSLFTDTVYHYKSALDDPYINALNIGDKVTAMGKEFALTVADTNADIRFCVKSCKITKQCAFASETNFYTPLALTDDGHITNEYSFIAVEVAMKNVSQVPVCVYLNCNTVFTFDNSGKSFDAVTELQEYNPNFGKSHKKSYFEYSLNPQQSHTVTMIYVIDDKFIDKIKDMFILFAPDGAGYPVTDNMLFVKLEY